MNGRNKKLSNWSAGGLGNRILGLISAYHFARETNAKLFVEWCSLDTGCMTPWEELFSVRNDNIEFSNWLGNVNDFCSQRDEHIWIVHSVTHFKNKNQKKVYYHRNRMTPSQIIKVVEENADHRRVYYQEDGISPSVTLDSIISFFECVYFKNSIVKYVDEFCLTKNLRFDNTFGLHLRMTDFNKTPNFQHIDEKIRKIINSGRKIFVCSDDKFAEDRILKMFGEENIVVNKKSSYVKKYDTHQKWIGTAGQFPSSQYNVLRDTDSVIEAAQDCLILSRLNLNIFSSGSSFFKVAQILAKANN